MSWNTTEKDSLDFQTSNDAQRHVRKINKLIKVYRMDTDVFSIGTPKLKYSRYIKDDHSLDFQAFVVQSRIKYKDRRKSCRTR